MCGMRRLCFCVVLTTAVMMPMASRAQGPVVPFVVGAIATGGAIHSLGVNPLTNELYVARHLTDGSRGDVQMYDAATGALLATPLVDNTGSLVVDALHNRAYVSNLNRIVEIHGATREVEFHIPVDVVEDEIAIDPFERRLYAVQSWGAERDLLRAVAIDTRTRTIVDWVWLGRGTAGATPQVALDHLRNILYVAKGASLWSVSTRPMRIVGFSTGDAVVDLAVSALTGQVYVSRTGIHHPVGVNATTNHVFTGIHSPLASGDFIAIERDASGSTFVMDTPGSFEPAGFAVDVLRDRVYVGHTFVRGDRSLGHVTIIQDTAIGP